MTKEEAEYRKWHTPDDWDRRVAILKESIEGAKRRDARLRAILERKNKWRKYHERAKHSDPVW